MKKVPRPYQAEAIRQIREAFKAGNRRVVLVAPTGSGKTFMSSTIIEGAVSKGNRVMFIAHRAELIDQCSKTLDNIGVPHGVIKAGHPRRMPECPVQVASLQTLVSKVNCPVCKNDEINRVGCPACGGDGRIHKHMPDCKVIVIDECHRSLSRSYLEIAYNYPDALILGLTATPWRLDRKGLGNLYQKMVQTIDIAELTEQGHLLPLRYYAPAPPGLDGVELTSSGEYKQSSLGEVMGDEKLIGDIIAHWHKHAEGERTVAFAATVENSKDLVRRFNEDGVSAEHLDGDMPKDEREGVLERFERGVTRVVCNVDVLVEGYDLPSMKCVILARPTKSLTRYLQMVGRVMRPSPGQDYAIVLDHAGCKYIHGMPEDKREWTLDDRVVDTDIVREKPSPLTLFGKVQCKLCGTNLPKPDSPCPKCVGAQTAVFLGVIPEGQGELVRVKTDARCQSCGSENVTLEAHGDLEVKVSCASCRKETFIVDRFAAGRATDDRKRQELARLRYIQRSRKYKPAWANVRFKAIFGEWPPNGW